MANNPFCLENKAKLIEYVIMYVIEHGHVNRQRAKEMVLESSFAFMLDDSPDYVFERNVEYWGLEILSLHDCRREPPVLP